MTCWSVDEVVLLYHKYCWLGEFWSNESRRGGLLSRKRPVIKKAWRLGLCFPYSFLSGKVRIVAPMSFAHLESYFLCRSNHCNVLLKWISFSPNILNSFLSIKCYRFQLTVPKADHHCAPSQERNTAWNKKKSGTENFPSLPCFLQC